MAKRLAKGFLHEVVGPALTAIGESLIQSELRRHPLRGAGHVANVAHFSTLAADTRAWA